MRILAVFFALCLLLLLLARPGAGAGKSTAVCSGAAGDGNGDGGEGGDRRDPYKKSFSDHTIASTCKRKTKKAVAPSTREKFPPSHTRSTPDLCTKKRAGAAAGCRSQGPLQSPPLGPRHSNKQRDSALETIEEEEEEGGEEEEEEECEKNREERESRKRKSTFGDDGPVCRRPRTAWSSEVSFWLKDCDPAEINLDDEDNRTTNTDDTPPTEDVDSNDDGASSSGSRERTSDDLAPPGLPNGNRGDVMAEEQANLQRTAHGHGGHGGLPEGPLNVEDIPLPPSIGSNPLPLPPPNHQPPVIVRPPVRSPLQTVDFHIRNLINNAIRDRNALAHRNRFWILMRERWNLIALVVILAMPLEYHQYLIGTFVLVGGVRPGEEGEVSSQAHVRAARRCFDSRGRAAYALRMANEDHAMNVVRSNMHLMRGPVDVYFPPLAVDQSWIRAEHHNYSHLRVFLNYMDRELTEILLEVVNFFTIRSARADTVHTRIIVVLQTDDDLVAFVTLFNGMYLHGQLVHTTTE